jgi:hypothetical protein
MRNFNIFDPSDAGFLAVVNQARGAGIKVKTPRLVGMAVLDLSKRHMYRLYYEGVKWVWPNAELLLMDTDSFYIYVETEDIQRDLQAINSGVYGDFRIDTSAFNKTCPYKNALGVLKLESDGLLEIAGLRAKVYSLLLFEPDKDDKDSDERKLQESKKCKGIPKRVVKQGMNHELYKQLVLNPETGLDAEGRPRSVEYRRIQSRDHHLEHVEERKRYPALCNDKVFMYAPLHSRPLGHWRNTEP